MDIFNSVFTQVIYMHYLHKCKYKDISLLYMSKNVSYNKLAKVYITVKDIGGSES